MVTDFVRNLHLFNDFVASVCVCVFYDKLDDDKVYMYYTRYHS